MASTGGQFRMPGGSVYIVRRATAETGGEYVEMEFVLPAACVPPPPHVHRQQVEEYEVLEGRFDVLVDGTWRTLGPGERASVPLGALPHVPQPLGKARSGSQLAPARHAL
jgi:quercetin dioxygenase-like cupin family protein